MKKDCFVCEEFTREKITKEIPIGGTKVLVKDAPADVCVKCGSIYFDGPYIVELEKKTSKTQNPNHLIKVIKIQINGETKKIAKELNLGKLLEVLALPSERIAIELNKEVVRKKDWENILIKDADRIEIVHFVGGG